MKALCSVFLLLCTALPPFLLSAPSAAQSALTQAPDRSSSRRAHTAPELLSAPDEWIDRSLQWVNDMLEQFPPQIVEPPARRAALIRLDDIFHIEAATRNPLVQKFYRARMQEAVAQIGSVRVADGAQIWKLYNHGFFVRTPTAAIAFDIVPGVSSVPGFAVDFSLMERIADEADVLFISHRHSDHANERVAALFLDRGKPVVASEGLWAGQPIAARLIYPKRSADVETTIPIQKGKRVVKVTAYPGHQGADAAITNNVHLVTTPEDLTFMHTGDQTYPADLEWLDGVGRSRRVDVLFPNCSNPDLKRLIRGVNPALVITGHENEMGHTVEFRRDYVQSYHRLFGTTTPYLVMTWGETWHYTR